MRLPVLTFFLLACGFSASVLATEVYHWVDENGVSHFTQSAPTAEVSGVRKMIVEDTTPPDYDPEEDRYGVAQQQERMAALREDMKERRDAEQKRRRDTAARQPVVQYVDRYRAPLFWDTPNYRPQQPDHPFAVPFRTPVLKSPTAIHR
jgi:hypothetical protein